MSDTINNPGRNISSLALSIAQSQTGQCEAPKGSNSGPMVNKYLLSAGLAPGYAWCQAFVYWCYASAAAQLAIRCPAIRTAGVQECWNKTPALQKITKADALNNPHLILPGHQFILLFGAGTGHTGIVESIDGTTITTIEGNSNNDGSREGYEVVRHQRNLTDKALQGFIKYC